MDTSFYNNIKTIFENAPEVSYIYVGPSAFKSEIYVYIIVDVDEVNNKLLTDLLTLEYAFLKENDTDERAFCFKYLLLGSDLPDIKTCIFTRWKESTAPP